MEPIRALGAMSGTSMDGVDAAVLITDGQTIAGFGETGYLEYTSADRLRLSRAMGQWPGGPDVAAAAEVVETAHARLLSRFEADVVGFHGQTLAHDPANRRTHQAGDGAVLAEVLGRRWSGIFGPPMSRWAGRGRRWPRPITTLARGISARRGRSQS